MSAFTSKASGDWSAEGATTWNEANYPGKLAAGDTVTIQNGHTVTLDIANFPGGALGTVSVASGGKLVIGVAMDSWWLAFGGVVSIQVGGELEFSTGGSRTMLMSAHLYVYGTLDMDSSGMSAGQVHSILFETNAHTLIPGSASDVTIRGRSKTQKTLLNGAVAAAAGSAIMDDVTGWEDGDELVLAGTDPADWDAIDFMTIDTGGISGNTVTFTGTTTYAHADNGRVYNLTCSARIQRNDATEQFTINFNPAIGCDLDLDYVQFDCCRFDLKVASTDGGGVIPLKNCTFITRHASGNGAFTWHSTADGIEIEDCIFYGMQYMIRFNGFSDSCTVRRCAFVYCVNGFYQSTIAAGRGLVFEDCEFTSHRNTAAGWLNTIAYWCPDMMGGFAWSNANILIYHVWDIIHFRDFAFGYDPGGNNVGQGNSAVNEIQYQSAGQNFTSKLIRMDRCKFSCSDDNIVSNRNKMSRGARIISYNHRQVAGAYWEAQGAGYIYTDEAQQRSGTRCICIDGRTVLSTTKLQFRFVFTMANGDAVTVKYWAKKSGGITSADWSLGNFSGGLGGIASGADLGGSITTSYAQYTLTFDNVSAVDGDVELVLDVMVADGSDDFLYVDDVTVEFS